MHLAVTRRVFFCVGVEIPTSIWYNKLSHSCKSRSVGGAMVKNNIEVDVKVKCIEAGTTQAQLAQTIGTSAPYVNRVIKKLEGVVNKTFVQMMEALGYDIELTYVRREGCV